MTHPYYHAESSTRFWGGIPTDYLPLHQWMDSSKKMLCNFKHRSWFHRSDQCGTAISIFGDTIINSDNERVLVKNIFEQHIYEDCGGFLPSLSDWFMRIEFPYPDFKYIDTLDQAKRSAHKFGGEPEDYISIHKWFDETEALLNGDVRHLALRNHSVGIFECESLFGETIKNEAGKIIPVRYIAEQHIANEFSGLVPAVSDWLNAIKPAIWMSRASMIGVK